MEAELLKLLLFFAIAFVPSITGAISGIGGGIMIKPVLDALSGIGRAEINFMSGCTVLAMSGVSLFRFLGRKGGPVLDGKRGTALALGAALGGLAGKVLFSMAVSGLPGNRVGMIQSALLMLLTMVVIIYMVKKNNLHPGRLSGFAPKAGQPPKNLQNLLFSLCLGLALGMLSSFLGIGGGPINIMVISYFFSMDSKTTALHSIYTIFLSQGASLILTVITRTVPLIEPGLLMAMISGGALGGLAGSRMVRAMSNKKVDILFSVLMALVMLLSAYNLIRFME
jgi:uncharacterized membrane protein YfcA